MRLLISIKHSILAHSEKNNFLKKSVLEMSWASIIAWHGDNVENRAWRTKISVVLTNSNRESNLAAGHPFFASPRDRSVRSQLTYHFLECTALFQHQSDMEGFSRSELKARAVQAGSISKAFKIFRKLPRKPPHWFVVRCVDEATVFWATIYEADGARPRHIQKKHHHLCIHCGKPTLWFIMLNITASSSMYTLW